MNSSNSLSVNSFKSLAQKEEMFTTKQVAEQLHTSSKVVLTNAKKCLKNKVFENGKTTYFTKAEVTLILEQMKSNNKTHSSDLYFKSKGATTTELTPSLAEKWYTIQNLADWCGFDVDYLRNNIKTLLLGFNFNVETKKVGKAHQILYSSNVLKALKEYQINNGGSNATKNKEVVTSGNISFIQNQTIQAILDDPQALMQLVAMSSQKAIEMQQRAEIAEAKNIELTEYKADTEKKLANGELIETPSENVRNHLWQNIQKVGTSMNDYRKAWYEFWSLVKRDTSIDVKTRASNKDMKPLDYICNELSMDDFNNIFALSEKMKKEYCGE